MGWVLSIGFYIAFWFFEQENRMRSSICVAQEKIAV